MRILILYVSLTVPHRPIPDTGFGGKWLITYFETLEHAPSTESKKKVPSNIYLKLIDKSMISFYLHPQTLAHVLNQMCSLLSVIQLFVDSHALRDAW